MWVNRHKQNNALVVFIHGLLGNPWASWRGVPEILQRDFETDPLMRSYDVNLFQYDTSWFKQPAIEPFVCDSLNQFLTAVSTKYETVVLIGHSQGGLVAKLYVLDRLTQREGSNCKVDLIITFGTPHRGTLFAFLGLWLRQVRGMTPLSRNIKRLKRQWGEPHVFSSPRAPTATRRYIRSIAVSGAYDRLVRPRKSADGFTVDAKDRRFAGHSSLAKQEIAAIVVRDELRRHMDPADVIAEIERIRHIDKLYDDYVNVHGPMVSEIIRRQRPWIQGSILDAKVATTLHDFLEDFRARPLRKLALREALNAYTHRELGPET